MTWSTKQSFFVGNEEGFINPGILDIFFRGGGVIVAPPLVLFKLVFVARAREYQACVRAEAVLPWAIEPSFTKRQMLNSCRPILDHHNWPFIRVEVTAGCMVFSDGRLALRRSVLPLPDWWGSMLQFSLFLLCLSLFPRRFRRFIFVSFPGASLALSGRHSPSDRPHGGGLALQRLHGSLDDRQSAAGRTHHHPA